VYSGLVSASGFTNAKFDTRAGRREIKSDLRNIYDGTYETEGPKKAGIFRLGDKTNIHPMFTASMGVSRKLTKRVNLSLEHQVMASDNDYLDGIRFYTTYAFTQDLDVGHYTNLRLGINLGNFDKVTEPLYWLNPLDGAMSDIAALKQRPMLDLTDSDGDGIIDMLDQQKDSPRGARVDTRGVTLDSDADGIADHLDKEPFSPPGYKVDAMGVAQVPKPITETDVNRLIDAKLANFKLPAPKVTEWFLPMINFKDNSYGVEYAEYEKLYQIATVLKQNPELKVVAIGGTDKRSTEKYNNVLSYNRAKAAIDFIVAQHGIARDRLILNWVGEGTTLIPVDGANLQNRRVEFRVAKGETEMARPEGKEAGKPAPKKGSFKGNKDAGY
jgi:outer membrane protein OmpA-like peptidoglycan-associated protein